MYPGLVHAHSGLRWVLLVFLILTIIRAMGKRDGKTPWGDQDRKMALFTLIFAHLQAVLGLSLYFMSTKVDFSSTTMSSAVHRFFTMEHTLMMLIAIILITVGYRHAKSGNVRKVFGFFLAALLIILLGIPWPFRTALGAGWF